ncbi:MAG: metalloregulator ArsR/SmtB family transcription factor [Bacteroidia bacterium]|jgi:DNA-binding transcriptional ArsR family regulator
MSNESVFHAIADPTRREILFLLSKESMHLNAIAKHFSISRPAISKHIKVLTECGLIEIRCEGRMHYCEVRLGKLQPIRKFLTQFNTRFISGSSTFDLYLRQLESGKKEKKKTGKGK